MLISLMPNITYIIELIVTQLFSRKIYLERVHIDPKT